MTIGIICAMGKELRMLLQLMAEPATESIRGYEYTVGRIGGNRVVAMECGIGKVNAALGAQAMIDRYAPDVIINSGVAGGTGRGAGVLDVVVATGIGYHDVWCGPGTEWGQADGCPPLLPTHPGSAAIAVAEGVKSGIVASGDIFVSRESEVAHINGLYPEAMAVDMESGAIAQTCYKNNVPMICVRVISDTPGAADNIAQYENFWDEAPAQTFKIVAKIIDKINIDK